MHLCRQPQRPIADLPRSDERIQVLQPPARIVAILYRHHRAPWFPQIQRLHVRIGWICRQRQLAGAFARILLAVGGRIQFLDHGRGCGLRCRRECGRVCDHVCPIQAGTPGGWGCGVRLGHVDSQAGSRVPPAAAAPAAHRCRAGQSLRMCRGTMLEQQLCQQGMQLPVTEAGSAAPPTSSCMPQLPISDAVKLNTVELVRHVSG